jgi:GH25 family lysozyme M1 (1,4-beta-N-acetylmuramidase)
MAFWDFIVKLFSGLKVPAPTPTVTPTEPPPVQVPPPSTVPSIDFDRAGTFLVADIYPPDLGLHPNYPALVGHSYEGKEFVGVVLKAGEGLGWGALNERWFQDNYRMLKTVGGERYGRDWFRGAYHFLRFTIDGAKQADYFVDQIEKAGGFDEGVLMPWVDAEEGGQGNWAGGEKLENIKDTVKRARLAGEVRSCITAFVRRFKERTGMRIAVYGRGLMRDLQMTNCNFGEDAYVNPAYTRTMPGMDQYGVPLSKIKLWQLCGDGEVFCPGFPKGMIKGWGAEDYSVYIDGANPTNLVGFRRDNLAKRPG